MNSFSSPSLLFIDFLTILLFFFLYTLFFLLSHLFPFPVPQVVCPLQYLFLLDLFLNILMLLLPFISDVYTQLCSPINPFNKYFQHKYIPFPLILSGVQKQDRRESCPPGSYRLPMVFIQDKVGGTYKVICSRTHVIPSGGSREGSQKSIVAEVTIYCMSTMYQVFYLSYLVLIATLHIRYIQPHSADGKTKVHRG